MNNSEDIERIKVSSLFSPPYTQGQVQSRFNACILGLNFLHDLAKVG